VTIMSLKRTHFSATLRDNMRRFFIGLLLSVFLGSALSVVPVEAGVHNSISDGATLLAKKGKKAKKAKKAKKNKKKNKKKKKKKPPVAAELPPSFLYAAGMLVLLLNARKRRKGASLPV